VTGNRTDAIHILEIRTMMKSLAIRGAALASLVVLAGCDITALDNYAAPTSTISGRVLFDGQPIGVRSNGVQLELWQPGFELNTKIPVHIDQDGSFTATVFDGDYEINLLRGNGPWQNDETRRPFTVNGTANIDIAVQPYRLIRNAQVVHDPAGGGPNGSIRATFNVQEFVTSPALEWVGVYVHGTTIVDRNVSFAIGNAIRERNRAAILPQLTSGGAVAINVPLPADVYLTGSPARREHVFVRVGVKTVGVAEMAFTPVFKVSI
jgi:hypothetical protein